MIDALVHLRDTGKFADIRENAATLTAGLTGDELSRAYLIISQAHEKTSSTGDDYRLSLVYARCAIAAANEDSLYHVWAHGRLAALSADMGNYGDAIRFGKQFLDLVSNQPSASVMVPYAWFAIGRAESRLKHHGKAIQSLKTALETADGELAERIRITLARTYARAGFTTAAVIALPENVEYVSEGKLQAARSIILAKCGDWKGAQSQAQAALSNVKNGESRVYDAIETAELYLVLKACAQALGNHGCAGFWFARFALTLSAWNATLITTLPSTIAMGGGERVDEETSHRGCAGHHRCGVRGTVG